MATTRLTLGVLALTLAVGALAYEDGEQEHEHTPQRANCNILYPPYIFHESEAQYVVDPVEGGWEAMMFATRNNNGADSLEMGKLTIHPGSGWPPHRHLAADEWLYVLSGEGGYAYWGMDHPEPTELPIGPGSVMFNQQGQLHKVWNNGSEPLVLFGVSKSIHPFEVLSDWPETPNGGAGHIPAVAPWDAFCAPGHDHGAEEWAEEGHGYEEGSHVEFESAGEEGSHVEFEAAGEL